MPEFTPASDMRFSAPTPEVQHLPTLFRRIQSGEVRIPAFQRAFVWKEKQVLDLLESVYRGYPIGSLLFWRVDERTLAVDHDAATSFPDVPERYPLSFVLDGLQRLSTLYGVFHHSPSGVQPIFDVVFDLREQRFLHATDEVSDDSSISLAHIFSPRDFIAAQKRLSEQADGELLLERTILLHSVFQEYMIPTVTLTRRSLPDVVQIFERVNSTGLRLDAVDFMRAVTWSEDFDLTRELAALSARLESEGFRVPSESLMKVVALIAGKLPTPASMLELRTMSAAELTRHVDSAASAVLRAIVFLNSECKIYSNDFVPYEGQLLVLSKFFSRSGLEADESQLGRLRRWFWAVGFNEELRGKPDHYVVRLLRRVDALMDGDLDAMPIRLSISPEDFIERRMLAGASLSGAVAGLFAMNRARSLVTGEVIEAEWYRSSFDTGWYVPLFGVSELRRVLTDAPFSAKLMANIAVSTPSDSRILKSRGGLEKIIALRETLGPSAEDVLRSQLISEAAVAAILDNDIQSFIEIRASTMHEAARSLVE